MYKHIQLLAFILALLLVSCENKKDEEPEPKPDYTQLEVGNYWIYQRFELDSAGNATQTDVYDSCYIEKDTLIRGEKYFKMIKPGAYGSNNFEIDYLRDSLDYMVNSYGTILFAEKDTNILNSYAALEYDGDTIYSFTTRMGEKDKLFQTPAGTFATYSLIMTVNSSEEYFTDPDNREHILYYRYANNIGIVSESMSFFLNANLPRYERRLVRYYIGD